MKKFFCFILTVVIALSGIIAYAENVETEKSVQIEIAPFLYKSTLFQMEFPSHLSYNIKEKSIIGDYAVSRELNDLAYSFVFPAGTTKFECKVSLDGKTDWQGVSLNVAENSSYWPKDKNGNIDYSQPVTFKRVETDAEQDEYGILYRDYLKDKDVGGFRNYDKIYWRLNYICNGKEYSEYFDIKLYDYDKSEKHTVRTVNFNVAGLPFSALNGENARLRFRSAIPASVTR